MTDDQMTRVVEAIDRVADGLTEIGEFLAGIREHLMHMRPQDGGEGILVVRSGEKPQK